MSGSAPHDHARAAAAFVANDARAHWHDEALHFVRRRRDARVAEIPEWEALRATASAIKRHTIARLPDYLEAFERNATALGARVHWAEDAQEHNRIVQAILAEHSATRVVKSKSMLTEECGLNAHLESRGVEIVDTDLGERIVQLRREPPSHIVLPAIHLKKEDVGATFHVHLGTPAGLSDPKQLTEAARAHLRRRFLEADAAITGVNFAVAENGAIVVCTNEGNADLGTALPAVHIACMGIEKLVPRMADLGVFLRLLARSATGQAITTYTSHYLGPREGKALHIVLVDNGRSAIRANEAHRRALDCIRCGACMNTCPVFRRSGGHSYATPVPGPIGSILSPLREPARHRSLPFACSLCGSCTDVCPVRIDLHPQLLRLRSELTEQRVLPRSKTAPLRAAAFVLARPALYEAIGRLARAGLRMLPARVLHALASGWTRDRELPLAPRQSFRQALRARRGARGRAGREEGEGRGR